jgi:hypothetical protein
LLRFAPERRGFALELVVVLLQLDERAFEIGLLDTQDFDGGLEGLGFLAKLRA